MPKFILFPVLVLLMLQPKAQNGVLYFGAVTPDDLKMKSCDFEPEAPAMKIFDLKNISFDMYYTGTKTKTERHVRIKIFKESGYKHTTIKIPYFNKRGVAKIKEINGAIYNLDEKGKVSVRKLDKKDFFKTKAIENVGLVSFTFPGVKPGSIIEYSYTTVETDVLGIEPWIIQGQIPVYYTSVSITTPVRSGITEWVMGGDTVEKTWELLKYDQFRRNIFFKKNIPSFRPEPFMSSFNDHLLRAVFMLFPYGNNFYVKKGSGSAIWKSAGSQLLRSDFFNKELYSTIPGTENIIDSAKKIKDLSNRINFIYSAVQQRWQGEAEQTTMVQSLSEAWKERSGTSAEINLALLNLLIKSDIKSLPVLISTRNHGKVNKDFPGLGQLNGIDVIAFDSTNFYMLDASIKYQPFNIPPANILNREVFVLNPDSMYWTTIVDSRPLFKQNASIIADMTATGTLEGTATVQHYDYAKAQKLDTTETGEADNSQKKIFNKLPPEIKIITHNKEISGNTEDPLFETIDFIYEPSATNEFHFINPWFLVEKNQNPLLAEKRMTDIDLGSNQLLITSLQIQLNGLYEVEHLPKSVKMIAPDSSFIYQASYSNSNDKISATQIIETNRALFDREEYPALQEFFKKMFSLMAEDIILKKKK
jgi:hypothetical protein